MLKLNCRNTDSAIIGEENGLNLSEEFENYKERISEIIKSLNQRKDKPGQWLQWMNLGYNEETVWYVKEFASMDAMKYWNRVDWYNGGMEHTARHLLYARFWVQFLYNIGLVPKKEMIATITVLSIISLPNLRC